MNFIKNDAPIIGKYGMMFQQYLKENYPGRITELALATTLWDICAEVNSEAIDTLLTIQEHLKSKIPPPKSDDFIEKVQYNNWLRDTAEEIVLQDIVYKYR